MQPSSKGGTKVYIFFPGNMTKMWGGRVGQRCWTNSECRGALLIWIIVGQGPIAFAVGAGGSSLDISSLIYLFSFLSPSLGDDPI